MFSTQGFGNNGNMNTGTVLGIAGEDFAIVASDTRLSEGYAIQSRESPKCYKLTDTTVIGCTAFHGDCLALTKIIDARITMYHCNPKTVNSGAIAGMLSIILSGKRFFPYYVYNIIGGLDMEGKGAVYNFDPVGSYQRAPYMAAGSAAAMLQPLLDNQVPHSVLGKGAVYSFDAVGYYQRDTCKVAVGGSMAAMIQPILDSQIGFKNREFVQHLPLTKEKAVQLVKDMFISAAERDVYTGDALQICVITKEGIKTEMFPLRDD